MKDEILRFIRESGISPFEDALAQDRGSGRIFSTKDARAVYSKVVSRVSSRFRFKGTRHVLSLFYPSSDGDEIKRRQDFISSLPNRDAHFLEGVARQDPKWRPPYSAVAATEDSDTFSELKRRGIPVVYIQTQQDVQMLDSYDLVQAVDCETLSGTLEELPQCVFVRDIDHVFLERHLRQLSGWRESLSTLAQKSDDLSSFDSEAAGIVKTLHTLTAHLDSSSARKLTLDSAESALKAINDRITEKIRDRTVSGDSLLALLKREVLPAEFREIVTQAIISSGMPLDIFNSDIPVSLDHQALDKAIKDQNSGEHVASHRRLSRQAPDIARIPDMIGRLSDLLVYIDFISGISEFKSAVKDSGFPRESEELRLGRSSNLFLDDPQPISFYLDNDSVCSILTGANSGGKTTLIEHILQLVSLHQMGLPASGEVKLPVFTDVYYFAKSKGSMSKGAFETLLVDMSRIKIGKSTLILADEIEAVTEPGVASRIICSTAEFFISKGCMMVVATHLGMDIVGMLPRNARIDGIEAKGIDEDNNLIVDHNPVLGRLAHSTPELIVERLANSKKGEFFQFVHKSLKNEKAKKKD